MLEESGLSLPTPFPWRSSPCVAELGGWVLWRREAGELDQGFVRCQTWREGILVLVFKINKDVMSFFFPNHCSMCDWISISDHMMMLFRSLVHVYLIRIVLYVVIMVWGRYNLFCRSLEEREEQEEDWRAAWINLCLAKVLTILISETCCYMLAEHCASLFQP